MSNAIFTSIERGKFVIHSPLDGRKHTITFKIDNSDSFREAERKAEQIKNSIVEAITTRLGRAPSPRELQQGFADGVEARTPREIMEDKAWTPVKRTDLSPLEKLLEQTNERIADSDSYKNMTPDEARRADLEMMIKRDHAEAAAEEAKRRHLEQVGPKLALINEYINKERWSPNASEAFRATLSKCKEQLMTVDGCPQETAALLNDVRDIVRHRKFTKQSTLMKQQAQLLSEVDAAQRELDALEFDFMDEQKPVTDADLESETAERHISDQDELRRYKDARRWNYDGDIAQQYAETGQLPE
jgi:hypothetical protein